MPLVQKQRRALAYRVCVSDMFLTQHNTASPRGGPWQSCSHSTVCFGQCSWSQVRDGCQVSATLGQTSVSLCGAVHCSWPKTDCEPWLSTSAPETVPSARGPGGAPSPSQTSCRAPDVDLSSPAEADNTAKTVRATECWNICLTNLSHVLSVGCDHSEVWINTVAARIDKSFTIKRHRVKVN